MTMLREPIYRDMPDYEHAWMPAMLFDGFSNVIANTPATDTILMARRMGVDVDGRHYRSIAMDVCDRTGFVVRQHDVMKTYRGN